MASHSPYDPPPLLAAKVRVPAVSALPRPRLEQFLARVWDHRLGLVVAPAGSGKTTLLARFAASIPEPVAWYRAETGDGDPRALLAYIESALSTALGGLAHRPWRTVEDAARALDAWAGARALLVIDDLHGIHGTAAEALVLRLVGYAPPSLAIIVSSRSVPGFDVSRLRVGGELLEVRADDLRFRTWEVESLFQDVYRERHAPEEFAELARRTEGWAAGLQLYHLATHDLRPDERRGVLAALGTRSRWARDYLAGNVLDTLPVELRRFLLETCVLGRLTGPLCDALLGRSGSVEVLDELVRRQIFTTRSEHDDSYRYHEVLRSHLCTVLVEEEGEAAAARCHVHAAVVLEDAGAVHDALLAYCRGGDWDAVGRLLGHEGEQIAHDPGEWLDLVPAVMGDQDPWVRLATARRRRAAGRWSEALAAYRQAEDLAGAHGAGAISRRERRALAVWLEPDRVQHADWSGEVRQATVRDPQAARIRAAEATGVHATAAAGLVALLAGDVRSAARLLARVAQSEDASPTLVTGARLGAGVAGVLAGDAQAVDEINRVVDDAEALGVPWLARLGRSLLALDTVGGQPSDQPPRDWPAEDRWGRSLDALATGLGAVYAGEPVRSDLDAAARDFSSLGAEVLAVWCAAVRAVDLTRDSDRRSALAAARMVEARSRLLEVPGAQAFAQAALAATLPEMRAELGERAEAVAAGCGLRLPPVGHDQGRPDPGVVPAVVTVRCLGGFALAVDGENLDLGGVRPRVRSLLRLLAAHAGRAVHREVIVDALWPDAPGDVGTRGLHVAVSTLRRALPAVQGLQVIRDGDGYRLSLPGGTKVDVTAIEQEAANAQRTHRDGDTASAVASYLQVLDLYAGELLPEEGPAEWVVPHRDRLAGIAIAAARSVAGLLFAGGDPVAAALACNRGLEIDRYQDGLWRSLIDGLDAAGDQAAAGRARARYDEVLLDLGLAPDGDDQQENLRLAPRLRSGA